MERCLWTYTKGMIKGEHFAVASCMNRPEYLAKLRGKPSAVGCADCYNGRLCPNCGLPIEIDYSKIADIIELA